MYSVYADYHNETNIPLSEPLDRDYVLINPKLTEKVGKSGAFTFDVSVLHPHFEKIRPWETYVTIFKDRRPWWYGRIIGCDEDFYRTRMITCEGELSYLNDSIVPPYRFTGTVAEYVEYLLGIHNANVEERKRIYAGTIAVEAENLLCENQQYPTVLQELGDQLLETFGGYFRTRHETDGKIYLDYVYAYGEPNTQILRPGENILDYAYSVNGAVCTRLIPLGAPNESSDERIPITVAPVNDGKIYIDNAPLKERFGIITGTMNWPEVTSPEELLAKGQEAVMSQELPESFTLTAVDLSALDATIESLRLGCTTTVISPFHEVNAAYFLTGKVTNLDAPEKDEVQFGESVATFTGISSSYTAEANKGITAAQQEIFHVASVEASAKAKATGMTITGVNGGHVWVDAYDSFGNAKHPTAIYVMDNADKLLAVNVLRVDRTGVALSTTGINGAFSMILPISGGNLYLPGKWNGMGLVDVIADIYTRIGGP